MSDSPLAPHTATPAELQQRHDAARKGTPFVVLRSAGAYQQLVELTAGRMTIGRGASNDVALTWDDRASRLHAELELVGGEWVIIDDGLSTNGTWVGENRVIGRRRLRDGDVIRIGTTLIAFCAPASQSVGTVLADDPGAAVQVTPAQRRVLVALCAPRLSGSGGGVPLTNRQLAEQLYLSVDAIKTHLRALMVTFGLEDVPVSQKRATLVERAVRLGIVTARDVG